MYNRRSFLKATATTGAALLTSSCAGIAGAERSKPNLVVLFVDDFGWADIQYRIPASMRPNMERLATESMVFTDAYATSPTCSPSRASMLTGRHPARLRIVRHIPEGDPQEFHQWKGDPVEMPSRNWLPLDVPTYGDALRKLGYKTAFVGKWHLGPEKYFPANHGFDEQFGVTGHGHPRGYYPPYFKDSEVYRDAPKNKYLTDRLTDDAVAYIRRQKPDEPFHLSLYYYGVHSPFQGRRDLLEKCKGQGFEGKELEHAAMVGAVDESLGRIREALEEAGLSGNTILLFIGDQGGPFRNAPLRGGKQGGTACYEGGARIPFMVNWPGKVKPGTCETPVVTDDVFPTLLEAAGGRNSDYPVLDGLSLMPLLTGEGNLDRDAIFIYRSYEDQYGAIRCGDMKMIAYRSGKAELYDIRKDISETWNYAPGNPEMIAEMKAKFYAWEKTLGLEKISGCGQ